LIELSETPTRNFLFLLCGLPFSGKSTLARALTEKFNIDHVEVDRHLDVTMKSVIPGPEDWLPAYRMAITEIRESLEAGRSVVFDAVGHHRRHRQRMQRIAQT